MTISNITQNPTNRQENSATVQKLAAVWSVSRELPWGKVIQIVASAVSLLALLSYTWVHTGKMLSRYIDPAWVGYIAALGVELAIIALSIRIGLQKGERWEVFGVKISKFSRANFTLLFVLLVSSIANIYEGYVIRFPSRDFKSVEWADLQSLGIVEVSVGLAATLVIPIVVFALSEIVGGDVEQTQRAVERNRKKYRKPQGFGTPPAGSQTSGSQVPPQQTATEAAAEQARHNQQQREEFITQQLQGDSKFNVSATARQLNVDRGTIYADLERIKEAGIIAKSGSGWELVS